MSFTKKDCMICKCQSATIQQHKKIMIDELRESELWRTTLEQMSDEEKEALLYTIETRDRLWHLSHLFDELGAKKEGSESPNLPGDLAIDSVHIVNRTIYSFLAWKKPSQER